MSVGVQRAVRELTRNAAEAECLPCGHTKAQAAWLGCTQDECRPHDEMIARQVQAQSLER